MNKIIRIRIRKHQKEERKREGGENKEERKRNIYPPLTPADSGLSEWVQESFAVRKSTQGNIEYTIKTTQSVDLAPSQRRVCLAADGRVSAANAISPRQESAY